MADYLEQEGQFQVQIHSYTLKENEEKGSLTLLLTARVMAGWNGKEWEDWSDYDQEVRGMIWLVSGGGKLNEKGAAALAEIGGWDGDLDSLAEKRWVPAPCRVIVKGEDYQGQRSYRFSNLLSLQIPAKKPVEIGSYKAQFGSRFRAITQAARRAAAVAAGEQTTEDIPF